MRELLLLKINAFFLENLELKFLNHRCSLSGKKLFRLFHAICYSTVFQLQNFIFYLSLLMPFPSSACYESFAGKLFSLDSINGYSFKVFINSCWRYMIKLWQWFLFFSRPSTRILKICAFSKPFHFSQKRFSSFLY